jgi:phage gp36-like protein
VTYATQQQLTDRYGLAMLVALTDRGEEATGTIDPAVLTRVLADTDAMIDGYLMARYALPLSTVPPLVTDLAQVIAIWKLHTSEPDPKIKADYDAAMRQLADVSKGILRLPVAGIEPPTSGASGARITDRERPFTEANMKGWI